MIISIFVWHNPIVLFTLLFLSSYATAISNPKSDTIVIFSIVEERQNAVFSIFSTIVTATVPLGAAVILALNQSLGATWSWTLLAFLAVFNIGYTCFGRKRHGQYLKPIIILSLAAVGLFIFPCKTSVFSI